MHLTIIRSLQRHCTSVAATRKLAAERDEIHRRWGEQHQRIIAEHQRKVNELQAQFAAAGQHDG